MRIIGLILGVVIVLAWAVLVVAEERFVDANNENGDLNGTNDCLDMAFPCQTITQATKVAEAEDTIKVAPGTYNTDLGEVFPIIVDKQLAIVAAAQTPGTIIDGTQFVIIEEEEGEAGQGEEGKEIEEAIIRIAGKVADESLLRGFIIKGGIVKIMVKKEEGKAPEVTPIPLPLIGILIDNVSSIQLKKNKVISRKESIKEIGIDSQTKSVKIPEIKSSKGILLRKSSSSMVANNTINQSENEGIRLEESFNNTLSGNKVFNSDGDGILLFSSNENKLVNNTVERNREKSGNGIGILRSAGNILFNNAVKQNKDSGILIQESIGNNLLLGNNTTNNGIGIALFLITVEQSKNNTLLGNAVNSNGIGITLRGSFKNTVLSGNIVTNNKDIGIELKGIFDNTLLSANRANNNGKDKDGDPIITEKGKPTIANGILFQPEVGLNNRLLNNEVSGNTGNGIFLKGSYITLSANTAIDNDKAGILLEGSSNNTLSTNMINGNEFGVILNTSSINVLADNVSNFNKIGISLQNSYGNKFFSNVLAQNSCNGIELRNSKSNEIRNNSVIQNADLNCLVTLARERIELRGGIVLTGASTSNTITGNAIQGNFNGISIRDNSQENTFQCNNILNNEKNGIQLFNQSVKNLFSRNNIEGNGSFGLHNFMSADVKVNAKFNWWGDPSGPIHPDNPPGKGDKILGPVNYIPWLENPIDPETCF